MGIYFLNFLIYLFQLARQKNFSHYCVVKPPSYYVVDLASSYVATRLATSRGIIPM